MKLMPYVESLDCRVVVPVVWNVFVPSFGDRVLLVLSCLVVCAFVFWNLVVALQKRSVGCKKCRFALLHCWGVLLMRTCVSDDIMFVNTPKEIWKRGIVQHKWADKYTGGSGKHTPGREVHLDNRVNNKHRSAPHEHSFCLRHPWHHLLDVFQLHTCITLVKEFDSH